MDSLTALTRLKKERWDIPMASRNGRIGCSWLGMIIFRRGDRSPDSVS